MPDSLQALIQRLVTGTHDEADVRAITAAITVGNLILANAPGLVSIGGNVSGSQIVTGHGNVTGDRNVVIYGAESQTI